MPDWQADFDKCIEQGTAKSTRRAYDRDIKYFFSWLAIINGVREQYSLILESIDL